MFFAFLHLFLNCVKKNKYSSKSNNPDVLQKLLYKEVVLETVFVNGEYIELRQQSL